MHKKQEHSSSTNVDIDLHKSFISDNLDTGSVDKTKNEHDYKDDLDNVTNTPEPAIVAKERSKEESKDRLAKSVKMEFAIASSNLDFWNDVKFKKSKGKLN